MLGADVFILKDVGEDGTPHGIIPVVPEKHAPSDDVDRLPGQLHKTLKNEPEYEP